MATRKQFTPFILISLFLLAASLRLYRLDSVPPSPSLDEVSLGYNAYAIAQTGADEYGTKFPVLLRAYDDFRPALYVYPVALLTKILGLDVLAVRLPSVLFSLGTLYFIYRAARVLGEKYEKGENIALWAVGIAAISPWHIYLSRLGHEVNLGLMLTTWGAYELLVWAMHSRATHLYRAACVLALSLYAYQSQKVVVPALLVCVGLFFAKRFIQSWKSTTIAVVLFVIVALPAVVATLSPEGMSRVRGTSAIDANSPDMQRAAAMHAQKVVSGDRLGALLTSKYMAAAEIISSQYVAHFSPGWVLSGRQRENHKVPYTGLMYWWEGILILLGIWFIWKRLSKSVAALILAWVLTGPLPAALTTQAPHAMRAFTAFPPLMILEALGVYTLLQYKRYRVAIVTLLLVLAASSAYRMSTNYFVTFPRQQSDSFQYALKDALSYVGTHAAEYDQVHIINSAAGYQSYMFFLYYNKFNVQEYMKLGGTISGGYDKPHIIGKYSFAQIDKSLSKNTKTLYVLEPGQVLPGMKPLAEFKNLDGTVVLAAVSW